MPGGFTKTRFVLRALLVCQTWALPLANTHAQECRKTSSNGVRLIMKFEGFKHHSYRCPANKLTIGAGHLIKKNDDCLSALVGSSFDEENLELSTDEIERLLQCDLRKTEEAVLRNVLVPLNQFQFDTLVSFTFNLGARNLARSTLLRLLNEKHYDKAFDQLVRWRFASGRVLQGLLKRRFVELFIARNSLDVDFLEARYARIHWPDLRESLQQEAQRVATDYLSQPNG